MALHMLVIIGVPSAAVNLRTRVAIRSVAIAIPETGLLLLPTRPTIREETVAKKNPNITIMIAPMGLTGIAGTSQIRRASITIAIRTTLMLSSLAVRSVEVAPMPFMFFIAPPNVLIISGNDLIRLMIPPAARAPAPM